MQVRPVVTDDVMRATERQSGSEGGCAGGCFRSAHVQRREVFLQAIHDGVFQRRHRAVLRRADAVEKRLPGVEAPEAHSGGGGDAVDKGGEVVVSILVVHADLCREEDGRTGGGRLGVKAHHASLGSDFMERLSSLKRVTHPALDRDGDVDRLLHLPVISTPSGGSMQHSRVTLCVRATTPSPTNLVF